MGEGVGVVATWLGVALGWSVGDPAFVGAGVEVGGWPHPANVRRSIASESRALRFVV